MMSAFQNNLFGYVVNTLDLAELGKKSHSTHPSLMKSKYVQLSRVDKSVE